jgi:hypothetical protein
MMSCGRVEKNFDAAMRMVLETQAQMSAGQRTLGITLERMKVKSSLFLDELKAFTGTSV